MSNLDQSHKKQECENQRDCLAMLQLIVDGEATPEQKDHFLTHHLEECMPCFQHYHFDQAITELLKLKCTHDAPTDLITSIKNKISAAG